jgi:hypothetical protein
MTDKKTEEAVESPKTERTLHYFASDGNYGSAEGYVLMETTHWSELDWEIIESATDEYRPIVARLITESYEPGANEQALREAFARYGVDLSIYENKE